MELKFKKNYISDNLKVYFTDQSNQWSIIYTDGLYYIRWKEPEYGAPWQYVRWYGASDGFKTLSAAVSFINSKDWQSADADHADDNTEAMEDKHREVEDALLSLGFERVNNSFYGDLPVYKQSFDTDEHFIDVEVLDYDDQIYVKYSVDGKRIPDSKAPKASNDIARTIKAIDRFIGKYGTAIMSVSEVSKGSKITAASTRELAQKLMRVRSSNVWAYYLNVKKYGDNTGDLLVQFKAKNGGPGDIYIYYDVPVRVFHRWQSAPSKGHYFWQYIRNVYKYHKLTGNKRGVLPNAIN